LYFDCYNYKKGVDKMDKIENVKNIENEKKKAFKIETRTIEDLLKDLRQEKGWTYLHIVEELNKIQYQTNEKQVKKWEIGIEYPDLDAIYKLSELYSVASEVFIMAKNNSFQKGLESIHMVAIKWICYFTGLSIKVIYVGLYVIIALAFLFAVFMIKNNSDMYLEIRRMQNG